MLFILKFFNLKVQSFGNEPKFKLSLNSFEKVYICCMIYCLVLCGREKKAWGKLRTKTRQVFREKNGMRRLPLQDLRMSVEVIVIYKAISC